MSDAESSPTRRTQEDEDDAMTSRADEPARGDTPEITKQEASNALGDMVCLLMFSHNVAVS